MSRKLETLKRVGWMSLALLIAYGLFNVLVGLFYLVLLVIDGGDR